MAGTWPGAVSGTMRSCDSTNGTLRSCVGLTGVSSTNGATIRSLPIDPIVRYFGISPAKNASARRITIRSLDPSRVNRSSRAAVSSSVEKSFGATQPSSSTLSHGGCGQRRNRASARDTYAFTCAWTLLVDDVVRDGDDLNGTFAVGYVDRKGHRPTGSGGEPEVTPRLRFDR